MSTEKEKFDKRPDFHKIEEKTAKFWEDESLYRFMPNSNKPVYSIDTPPPTISGRLHIGHAFSYSQTEFIARYKRMAGFNVYYPFGYDNNGLPTEMLTEEKFKIRARDLPRQEFVKKCLETSAEVEKQYEEIFKRMGLSCDWAQIYRTIEPRVQRLSQASFLGLHKIGRVYRKFAPTIWCPKCGTAISQTDLEDKDVPSKFNYVLFELENGEKVEIATTRPELLSSCLAVFVHPDDKKHADLIGKKAKVPLFNMWVPIRKDESVDPEKGTGIVMFCTFGDLTDVEWFNANDFEAIISVDAYGKMTDAAGKYKGLSIKEAREKITADLKAAGLLVREEPLTHTLNAHERCGTPIEFLLSKQWFVKYLDLKEKYIKAGKEMKWFPGHMRVRFDNWVNGLQWDWCISRQRYFGIPFPVWYCKKCGKELLASAEQLPVDPLKDKPKGKCACGSMEFEPEKDVLDTWATSSLTPLINAGWNEKGKEERFKLLYPMTLRANAHDIITFWDFHTVAMDLFHTKKVPFRDVMISGHGLGRNGKKMSKSRGNVVKPIEVMDKYSADALRWWAAGVKLGEDLNYREEDILAGIKMGTKLWNVARFLSMHLSEKPKKPAKLNIVDEWILAELDEVISRSTNAFDSYEYSKAKSTAESFFWNLFCDNYLEMVKYRLYGEEEKDAALWTLYSAFLAQLKLFSPFIPFIAEEIYQRLFLEWEKGKSIHISSWPKAFNASSAEALETGRAAVLAVAELRKWKKEKNLSLGAEVGGILLKHPEAEKMLAVQKEIAKTMRAAEVKIEKAGEVGVSEL